MNMKEFAERRQMVMQKMHKKSIALIPTAPIYSRNGDCYYPYWPDSDFYYLTGFTEPDAILVLCPDADPEKVILFNRPRDPLKEQWEGKRVGQEGACEQYGADNAYPISSFEQMLPELLQHCDNIYYPTGLYKAFDKILFGAISHLRQYIRRGVVAPQSIQNIQHIIHKIRLIKRPFEIDIMRKVTEISATAHAKLMAQCRPGINEYHLASEFHYQVTQKGCQRLGYDTIVGGGANACTLHYTDNDQLLKDGDLVLIDAGGAYDFYCADITRTFPVNGKFSPAQQAIYEIVLSAQVAAIDSIRPGVAWPSMQQTIVTIITEGLVRLGILVGDVSTLIKQKAYLPFYMHLSGHWLGLDVHDVGGYKQHNSWCNLEPGMILTVEPGIYIQPSDSVDEKWWGIGVRIEDDVLVTESGYEVLTSAAPKTIADIESLMASGRA